MGKLKQFLAANHIAVILVIGGFIIRQGPSSTALRKHNVFLRSGYKVEASC